MDMLLAPVYEDFLAIRANCMSEGGFVVGPMGAITMIQLAEYAAKAGVRDTSFRNRYNFDPLLPGVVYESHVKGGGRYGFLGLVDEIEINTQGERYRFPKMKPGEGCHGEDKSDERMPAFVRFRVLRPVAEVMPSKNQLWASDLGLGAGDSILRHFKVVPIRKTFLRETFEQMMAS